MKLRELDDAELDDSGKRRRAEEIARGNAARRASVNDLVLKQPRGIGWEQLVASHKEVMAGVTKPIQEKLECGNCGRQQALNPGQTPVPCCFEIKGEKITMVESAKDRDPMGYVWNQDDCCKGAGVGLCGSCSGCNPIRIGFLPHSELTARMGDSDSRQSGPVGSDEESPPVADDARCAGELLNRRLPRKPGKAKPQWCSSQWNACMDAACQDEGRGHEAK